MFVIVYFILNLNLINPTAMRPSTLNLQHQQNHDVSKGVLRDAYRAWNERSDKCIVPEPNIKALFRDFKLFPTTEQVHDMLHTARQIVRLNNGSKISKHKNGLTFGEFSVLLSDIRKLRHTAILKINDSSHSSGHGESNKSFTGNEQNTRLDQLLLPGNETTVGPEVFLGGSCNPTTWRADVAIPKLNELGITFYNPVIL